MKPGSRGSGPVYLQSLSGGDRYPADIGGRRADPAFEGDTFQNPPTLPTTIGTALQLCKTGGDNVAVLGTCSVLALVKSLGSALPEP